MIMMDTSDEMAVDASLQKSEPPGEENMKDKSETTSSTLETNENINRTYYFESDHLALKGNKDYHSLLRSIVLLEAQRAKAIKDLDKLISAKKEALSDPIGFVDKLQRGEDLGFPASQNITELPDIKWENYMSGTEGPLLQSHHHQTRNKKTGDVENIETKPCPSSSTMVDVCPSMGFVVRGRVKDQTKSATFNQLWTAEEQRRLEQLLVEFPPEEVEARRWKKIAKALGNRTTQQVASRVQKYFIKLAKAGLPVPGRIPSAGIVNRRIIQHRHQRNNKFYRQASTFLLSHQPPVYMSDDEMESGSFTGSSQDGDLFSMPVSSNVTESIVISDDEDIPDTVKNTDEYKELLKLKRIRREKLMADPSQGTQHIGYKCDNCGCEPILGTRWHCVDCLPEVSVDFCDNCTDSSYETESHNSSHRLEPIRFQSTSAGGHMDRDYMRFMQGDYNYLDPNYMPAT